MENKLNQKKDKIFKLIKSYIKEKRKLEKWKEGDWVAYSGPHYDEKEYIAAMNSLLDEWLVFGNNCRQFELEFASYMGKKYGVFVNSGSSANLLMLAALKSRNYFNLANGTKFITPAVAFPTTVNPIIQNGFTPVFVDVDLPSLNLDLKQTELLLKKDSSIRGIVFAHVLGNCPDLEYLMYLIEKYNLIFLEDACDSLSSTYKNKKLGSFGIMSSMSFFPAHVITAGEGGFVATDDKKLFNILASLREWGRQCRCNTLTPGDVTARTACGNRFKNWLPGQPDVVYDHRYVFGEALGYNLKPLELQGAMGLEQLKKLPEIVKARKENYQKLKLIFDNYQQYFDYAKATPGCDPCWFAFPVTVKDNNLFTRDEFIQYLEKNKIQTRCFFAANILSQPGYYNFFGKESIPFDSYPNANKVTTNVFFLGTYIGLTEEKMKYIEKVVDAFFKEKLNK
jgi:CDP-6-deoxy-D-xylo-4-hexulose-3-dehydrase